MTEKASGLAVLITCLTCKQGKPPDAFYVYKRSGKRRGNCIECMRAYHRDWKKEHPDQQRTLLERTKKEDPRRYLFVRLRHHAAERGIAFDLTIDDIFIPEHCPVLGLKLSPVGQKNALADPCAPTVDRLDPALGYVRGNVEVISMKANRLKNNATAEELERIAAWMRAKGAT